MKKPWLFRVSGKILPRYIGNITSHFEDLYKPISIRECHKGFERCSRDKCKPLLGRSSQDQRKWLGSPPFTSKNTAIWKEKKPRSLGDEDDHHGYQPHFFRWPCANWEILNLPWRGCWMTQMACSKTCPIAVRPKWVAWCYISDNSPLEPPPKKTREKVILQPRFPWLCSKCDFFLRCKFLSIFFVILQLLLLCI